MPKTLTTSWQICRLSVDSLATWSSQCWREWNHHRNSVLEESPWMTSSGKCWKQTSSYSLRTKRIFFYCMRVYWDCVSTETVRQQGAQSDDANSTFMEFVLDGGPCKEPSNGKLPCHCWLLGTKCFKRRRYLPDVVPAITCKCPNVMLIYWTLGFLLVCHHEPSTLSHPNIL